MSNSCELRSCCEILIWRPQRSCKTSGVSSAALVQFEVNCQGKCCLMVKKSHGYRARTRSLMSKRVRQRGLTSVNKVLENYEEGQRVDVVIDPAFHKGMPHRRYQGRTGVVRGVRGRALVVEVGLGKAVKTLLIRPEHLQPSRG